MSRIIAISGISGAGKTTLTRALASRHHASHLIWDDFDGISVHPDDYLDWFEGDRDYSEWNYAELAGMLRALKMSEATIHPITAERVLPTALVFFDAPLGRLHRQTAGMIDLAMHIRLPKDIALCRRLIRDYGAADELSLEDLIDELRFYAGDGHALFDDRALVEAADIVIDGTLPFARQLETIDRHLGRLGYLDCTGRA